MKSTKVIKNTLIHHQFRTVMLIKEHHCKEAVMCEGQSRQRTNRDVYCSKRGFYFIYKYENNHIKNTAKKISCSKK